MPALVIVWEGYSIVETGDDDLYQLTLRRQAIRAMQRMPQQQVQRVRRELDKLAENPNNRDLDIVKLNARPGFRLRIGNLRVIFDRYDDAQVIEILRIVPRGQAYRE